MGAISNKINFVGVAERLNGTGNEGIGEEDVLNRPLKQLITMLEDGDIDAYSSKMAINLVDDNEFDASVNSEDLVMVDIAGSGTYVLGTPNAVQNIGFALKSVDNNGSAIIHVSGVMTFNSYTFIKGKFYYLSKSLPGKIVIEGSSDASPLVVGAAISNTQLYVRLSYDVEAIDNSAVMAIALGS